MIARYKILIAVVVLALAGGSFAILRSRRGGEAFYETVKATRKDIREEVAATGQVAPAKALNLQFENPGTVAEISVKIGDKVQKGAVLTKLDNRDLEMKVLADEAVLAQAQAKLAVAREGTRAEDIALAKTKLTNAETALKDAKANLDAVTEKAERDIEKVYESGRVAYLNNLLSLGNIREDVRDIYMSPPTKFSEGDTAAKVSFNNTYLATDAAYETARGHLTAMSVSTASRAEIKNVLSVLSQAAFQMSVMLDLTNRALAASDPDPAATRATIATDITNLKTLLTAVTDAQSTLTNTEAANKVTVQTAATAYNTALANAALAKEELVLKEAGSRPSEIAQFEAAVAEARARLSASRTALGKAAIISPVDGVVTAVPLEIGEIARAGSVAVSLITESRLQIDVNIPEIDIPKISVGAEADVTLDAFGPDQRFAAVVSAVDPSETNIGGVIYYKVTVLFEKPAESILPGMTANVTIIGQKRDGVLAVPLRAVQSRDGKKFVRVLVDGMVEEREVTLGLRGSGGEVEVISGLREGEEVVVFEKRK